MTEYSPARCWKCVQATRNPRREPDIAPLKLAVDRIKIAQSFIADIGRASGNDAIVKAALGLARELDIEVVVEGAETAAQIALLRSWGCRVVQGFYFSRALPVPEVTELLRIGRIALPAGVDKPAGAAAAA